MINFSINNILTLFITYTLYVFAKPSSMNKSIDTTSDIRLINSNKLNILKKNNSHIYEKSYLLQIIN